MKNINFVGLVIGILFSAVISGVLIWIVSLFDLGLVVEGFGPAFIAGGAIAVAGGIITGVLMMLGMKVSNGWLRAAINVLLGAVVLFVCDRLLPGLTVHGFLGALLASIAIGLIAWLLSLYPKRLNRAAEEQNGNAEH